MVHTCELCHFSTAHGHVYRRHMKSQRHQDNEQSANNNDTAHTCIRCSKRYLSYSGLWKHNRKCCPPTATQDTSGAVLEINLSDISNNIPSNNYENVVVTNHLMECIQQIQSDIHELKQSNENAAPRTSNTIHNHIHHNDRSKHIHIHMNSHFNRAMTVSEFVESIKFGMEEMLEMDKARYYHQGASKILRKQFNALSFEERPMHCITNPDNLPPTFLMKDDDQWKAECQSMINYQIEFVEKFENETEKLIMTRFFERFNERLFEHYQQHCKSDKKLERIRDKMVYGGGSKDRLDMLHEMKDMLMVEINDDNQVVSCPPKTPAPPSQSPNPRLTANSTNTPATKFSPMAFFRPASEIMAEPPTPEPTPTPSPPEPATEPATTPT